MVAGECEAAEALGFLPQAPNRSQHKPAAIPCPVDTSALLDPKSLPQFSGDGNLTLRIYLGESHSRFFHLAHPLNRIFFVA